MLLLRTVGRGQIDYYLPGPPSGRWTGSGCPSLGLAGPVDAASLTAVLAGRGPDGTQLLRRVARRRDGFDLILAAPKSVSLLAAMCDVDVRRRIERAHDQAVESALSYLERRAAWTRRRDERIATAGLAAASFRHHSSAADDPHLHTHALVANLVEGVDGVWSTLDSRSLYRHARAAGAVFQASLRHALAEHALAFDWKIGPSGLADIVGVPRTAIEACSLRGRQALDDVTSGSTGRRGRATAGGRTRSRSGSDVDGTWDVRAASAGFDRAAAAAVVGAAGRLGAPQSAIPPARDAVEMVLAERHSQFERHDVVQAVAGLTARGADGPTLERWADEFLEQAMKLDRRRWTTPWLRHMEQRITTMASRTAPPPAGAVLNRTVDQVLADRPHLGEADRRAVRRLTTGGAPVELLTAGNLVSQSWVIDAARAAWDASGHRVAVLSRTSQGAPRWQALAGLGRPPPLPAHPTVLVVDGVDRWPTAALHQMLADGESRNAKVVLIDGGTVPARRRAVSPAVEDLRARLPAIDCGARAPDPARLPEAVPIVRGGRDRSVAIVASGPAAMAQVVATWAGAHDGAGRAVMVAMGPEEAEYLNAAARGRLQAAGRLSGPAVEAGGRQFQAGDEVRALRHDRRLGSVPGRTVGVVAGVDPDRQEVVIRWPGEEVRLNVAQLAGAPVTHAYATTPAYLRDGTPGAVLALGDPRTVAPGLTPDAIVQVMADGSARDHGDALSRLVDQRPPARPAAGPADAAVEPLAWLCPERDRLGLALSAGSPPDPHRLLRWEELNAAIAWRKNALGQAAEIRPSRAVLGELGPRPATPSQQHVWRQAAQAIEAYRDRWSLPDRPLDLSRSSAPSQQLADALVVVAGCRALERARGLERALSPSGR